MVSVFDGVSVTLAPDGASVEGSVTPEALIAAVLDEASVTTLPDEALVEVSVALGVFVTSMLAEVSVTPVLDEASFKGSVAAGVYVISELAGESMTPVPNGPSVNEPVVPEVYVTSVLVELSVATELEGVSVVGSVELGKLGGEFVAGSNGAKVSPPLEPESAAFPSLDEGAPEDGVSVTTSLDDGAMLVQVLPSLEGRSNGWPNELPAEAFAKLEQGNR